MNHCSPWHGTSSIYIAIPFVNTVTHLGHLLYFNLSDAPDIIHELHDSGMVRKANNVLVTFHPQVLTKLYIPVVLLIFIQLLSVVPLLSSSPQHRGSFQQHSAQDLEAASA